MPEELLPTAQHGHDARTHHRDGSARSTRSARLVRLAATAFGERLCKSPVKVRLTQTASDIPSIVVASGIDDGASVFPRPSSESAVSKARQLLLAHRGSHARACSSRLRIAN